MTSLMSLPAAASFSLPASRPLHTAWVLWSHLPDDRDFSDASYTHLALFRTVEDVVCLMSQLPAKLVENCMFFVMRQGIKPQWEDTLNREGGYFSYKVNNGSVLSNWKDLVYATLGETLCADKDVMAHVTGITISPKRNFCILKIWMQTCHYQNPRVITARMSLVQSQTSLFQKHKIM